MKLKFWFYCFRAVLLFGLIIFMAALTYTDVFAIRGDAVPLAIWISLNLAIIGLSYALINNIIFLRRTYKKTARKRNGSD
jgi:uncharacterized membrane protein